MHWLSFIVLCGPLADNPNPWVPKSDADDIKIWQRQVPRSNIQEIRVEMVIDAPSRRVWEVMRDVDHYPEFMPYMAEARILREQGNTRIVYERISPPIVNDRDLTLKSVAYPDSETGVFQQRLSIANDQGPPAKPGVVRITVAKGGWTLEPLDTKTTRILYWFHTDPGGWIPEWIVNFGQRHSIPRLIDALEKRAQDPSWRL